MDELAVIWFDLSENEDLDKRNDQYGFNQYTNSNVKSKKKKT